MYELILGTSLSFTFLKAKRRVVCLAGAFKIRSVVRSMMSRNLTVVLHGTSLLMEGIKSSLSREPDLQIVHMQFDLGHFESELEALEPDAILCELDGDGWDKYLGYLRDHPDVTLIGLDGRGNTMTVLSSRRHEVRSAGDLAGAIRAGRKTV